MTQTAFTLTFEGSQEVPPRPTIGNGIGVVLFDDTTNTATYTWKISGLDFGPISGQASATATTADDVNGFHFHNNVRGVNGPIVFDIAGGQDADDLSIVNTGGNNWTVSGAWEPTDPANTSINSFAAALAGAAIGSEVPLYGNIHTTTFPGGEIRGQWVATANNAIPVADDFTADTATTGQLDSGLAFGNIGSLGDHDWFRVRLIAGHNYLFDQGRAPNALGTLADPLLALRDSAGNLITSNDDGGFGRESELAFHANTTGDFFLDAGAFANGFTGTYAVQSTDLGVAAATARFQPPVSSIPLFGQSPTAGGWTSQDQYPRTAADVNGDGQADLVGFGAAGVYVALNVGGDSFGPANLAIDAFGANPAAGWNSQNIYPRLLGDVTLDGRADIVGFANNGVFVSRANADGTFAAPTLALSAFGSDVAAAGWTSFDRYPRQLGDVNGDNRQDIVAFASNGVYVALADAAGNFQSPVFAFNGFGNDTSAGGWLSQDQYPRLVTDVNGDGRADIVAFAADGVHTALGELNGTFSAPIFALADFGNSQGWLSQNSTPRQVADINADGRGDIVGFDFSGVSFALGQANGTFGPRTQDLASFGSGTSAGGWTDQNTYPRVLADVTGDRRADIVGFGSSGVFLSPSHDVVSV